MKTTILLIIIIYLIYSNSKDLLDLDPEPDYYQPETLYYFNVPKSMTMEQIILLHDQIFYYILLIFVLITWLLFNTITLFKSHNNVIPTNFKYPVLIEIIWTVLPIIILIAIILPSFNLLYAQDESINPQINIKITGLQWYWNYETIRTSDKTETVVNLLTYNHDYKYVYIDADSLLHKNSPFYLKLLESTVKLEIPSYKYIRLLVTSNDVIHSWALPSLGIKVDAVPGRINQVTTLIKDYGLYYGQCSEICGANHGFMPITVLCAPVDRSSLIWF